MTIRTLTPAALAALALALGACGGADDEARAGDTAKNPQDAGLAFAKCMREQGIDFPDPVTDEDGVMKIGPNENIDPDDPRMKKAHEACRKHLTAEPPNLSAEKKKEMVEAGLRFAKCMREQGIDFPDPDSNGGIRIGPGSGVDLDSEGFRAAEEACRDEMPKLGVQQEGQR